MIRFFAPNTGSTSGSWTPLGQQQFNDRQEGTAVLQIDTTTTPPTTGIYTSSVAACRVPRPTEILRPSNRST
jgi:hypothetical protein